MVARVRRLRRSSTWVRKRVRTFSASLLGLGPAGIVSEVTLLLGDGVNARVYLYSQ
jgi:hypothetical protein